MYMCTNFGARNFIRSIMEESQILKRSRDHVHAHFGEGVMWSCDN